jgi:non-ribosomal peptide synthetase component F
MQATPATWQLLLEAGWQGGYPLHVLCGGEALPRRLAHHLLERVRELWNLYGPTETTIWSAVSRVEGESACVSIGHPIANTRFYVLDRSLQPVPIGVAGELYIGGAGLSRGYLWQAELTAEKFIPDAFGPEPGARLYCTGDLVRYLPNGTLEFLGRIDHQVKIRGFRIELGEIETALGQHPDVQQSVLLAREDKPGDKRLVAYVVPEDTLVPTPEELRSFLKETLPDYMIPTTFVTLDTLPLTPNGKVDRRMLPEPDSSRPDLAAQFVAPRTPTEATIADIWSEVLGVKQVGIYDNFFVLGGHSLLATQLVSRLRSIFGVSLSLRSLFDAQTVAEIATLLSQHQQDKTEETKYESIERLDRGESDIAALVAELKQLSDDEVQALLANPLLLADDSETDHG